MNEFDFIKRIRAQAQNHGPSPRIVYGIGDDAAVIQPSNGLQTVVSVDLLVEDIDFIRSAASPRFVGHKALGVSLSDIAAMGARPRWLLLTLGVPQDTWSVEFVDQLYEGVFQLADRYGVKLIGGDTSSSPEKVVVDSIVIGECVPGRAISRSGARPGDLIFVTGSLGGAAAGLRLLQRGAKFPAAHGDDPDHEAIDTVLLRQLKPEPRVGWGQVLGEEQLATAMIDLSDGLSSDLHHLCEESKVGALIEAAKIPIEPSVADLCGRRALDPLALALHGGEDYELLFTVSPANISKLPKRVDGISITSIGVIAEASEGLRIAEGPRVWNLEPGGWEHFAEGKQDTRL